MKDPKLKGLIEWGKERKIKKRDRSVPSLQNVLVCVEAVLRVAPAGFVLLALILTRPGQE